MPEPVSPTDDQITGKSIIQGTLVALACAIVGGILIAIGGVLIPYGFTMFCILPAATGFVTVLNLRYWKAVGISLMIAIALCLAGLVFTGIEGIICVLMALPLLTIGALLGAAFGYAVKEHVPTDTPSSMVLIPLLAGASVLGAGNIEDRLDTGARIEVVESTIEIDAARDNVWNAIIEFDHVSGPKPLLLRIGLPIPETCTISGTQRRERNVGSLFRDWRKSQTPRVKTWS